MVLETAMPRGDIGKRPSAHLQSMMSFGVERLLVENYGFWAIVLKLKKWSKENEDETATMDRKIRNYQDELREHIKANVQIQTLPFNVAIVKMLRQDAP
jgi:hypothetical protein